MANTSVITTVRLSELLAAMVRSKSVFQTHISLAIVTENFVGEDEDLLTPPNRTSAKITERYSPYQHSASKEVKSKH